MKNLNEKKIGVIGIGGRTGSMFFEELKNYGKVFGIGRKKEIEAIREKKVFLKKGKEEKILEGELISEEEFPRDVEFDFLFLAIKNPISPALEFYFKKIKKKNYKLPVLFLSQNGIGIWKEAISTLKKIEGSDKFSIFRISLFNPVDKFQEKEKIIISYSLPLKFAIAKAWGDYPENEIFDFFKKPNFQVFFLPQRELENMEYSKLFLNLLGMVSAKKGFSLKEGFLQKEIFLEEVLAIKEFQKVVKKAGGKFLNFPGYPVKFLSFLFSLPPIFLFPLRKILAQIIERKRESKMKNLDEIEYYNGAVVKLGEKLGIETPTNKKILEKQ